jgi:hypothetical protein
VAAAVEVVVYRTMKGRDMKGEEPRLVPFCCEPCDDCIETVASAAVLCRCGRSRRPVVASWLAALLVDGQRARSEVERLAAEAGLSWARVTAAARGLGVVQVTRGGERVFRLAPSRALRALMPQRVGSGKSPIRGIVSGGGHREPSTAEVA